MMYEAARKKLENKLKMKNKLNKKEKGCGLAIIVAIIVITVAIIIGVVTYKHTHKQSDKVVKDELDKLFDENKDFVGTEYTDSFDNKIVVKNMYFRDDISFT